jgi:hypothetical protein
MMVSAGAADAQREPSDQVRRIPGSTLVERGDRELVLAAARLGWTLAELRGRVRESVSGPPPDRARPKGILPLGQERSQKEQLIEYGNVVSGLAKRLDVDVPAQTLSHAPTDVAGKSASEWLRRSVWAVANPPDPDDTARLKGASRELANVYYAWDARIQDELAAQPSMSAAYQLGRGVGEIRWSLDLRKANDDDLVPGAFLLGSERGERIDRLIARLAAYYDPITQYALELSLQAWRINDPAIAKAPDDAWRSGLAAQATIWHDLIVGQRDGASLVSPRDVLEHPAALLSLAKPLAPEVLIAALGVVLLLVAAYVLTTPGMTEWIGAAAAVLGLTGVTASGLAAKARASATDLVTALRNDVYRNLVAHKAIVPPGNIQWADRGGAA